MISRHAKIILSYSPRGCFIKPNNICLRSNYSRVYFCTIHFKDFPLINYPITLISTALAMLT